MLALAGQSIADPRVRRSLDYLRQELSERIATISLCYGLLGLAAHGQSLAQADALLAAAAGRTLARDGSPQAALLALAALGGNCPLASRGPRSARP